MKIRFYNVAIIILSLVISIGNFTPVSANTDYWYKGANFNEYLTMNGQKKRLTDSRGNPLSVVVVTASTQYDGRSGGQEMVRVFSRNSIVQNYYNANAVRTVQVDLKFTNSDNRAGFVTLISPNESSRWTYVGVVEYFLKGYYEVAYHVAIALANNFNASVKHYKDRNNATGEIIFTNSSLNNVELPSTVSYRDAHNYYDGKLDSRTGQKLKHEAAGGVVGYFNFYYRLDPGHTANLEASARAWYEVQISHNGWPAIYSAFTDYATVKHDINGR